MAAAPGSWSFSRLATTLRVHPIATFVGIAFGLSWLLWSLVLLDLPLGARAWGRLRQGILFAGGLGPFVGALVVAWLGEAAAVGESGAPHRSTGRGDVVAWFHARLDLDVPRRLYLLALGGPLVLHVGIVLLFDALGGPITVDVAIGSMLPILPLLVVHHTLWAGGDEELGWRGVLHRELGDRFEVLPTSLLVGGAWALWHVPLFVLPTGLYRKQELIAFVGTVLALGILLGLLYEASAGSVVPAMLFHGTWNALDPFRPIPVWTLSPPGSLTLESRAELVVLWGTVALVVGAYIVRRRRAGGPG